MNELPDIPTVEYNTTIVHPIAIVFMLVMAVLALSSRRSLAVLAVVLVCVFMPKMQRIVIGGLDFSMLRLIVLLVWMRVFVRGEHRGLRRGGLDRIVVVWVVVMFIAEVLRVGPSAIVYRLGVSFDIVATYFLFRVLVRRRSEVLVLWRQVAWSVIALSPFLVYEFVTLYNPFEIFGMAPEETWIREGDVRCQGSFSHPILMGTFGSVAWPAFLGIYLGWKKQRTLMALAILGSTIITLASGSSGPVIAWGMSLVGWLLWRFRARMRTIVWSMWGMALVIHIIREKPVWHLISRVSEMTGGTGYHRYLLIDAFVSHFTEWALIGSDDSGYWGWGLWDTTSQYVAQGLTGGVLTFVLFILLLRKGFVLLRMGRTLSERLEGSGNRWSLFGWGLSVSLASHCVSFISVSYFGQIEQFFFMFLGAIPAVAAFPRPKRKEVRSEIRSDAATAPVASPA